MLPKQKKVKLIQEMLLISDEDLAHISMKIFESIGLKDPYYATDAGNGMRKVVDESPTLREAAMAGALVALSIMDHFEDDPTIKDLQEKRADLLKELSTIERQILLKRRQ